MMTTQRWKDHYQKDEGWLNLWLKLRRCLEAIRNVQFCHTSWTFIPMNSFPKYFKYTKSNSGILFKLQLHTFCCYIPVAIMQDEKVGYTACGSAKFQLDSLKQKISSLTAATFSSLPPSPCPLLSDKVRSSLFGFVGQAQLDLSIMFARFPLCERKASVEAERRDSSAF